MEERRVVAPVAQGSISFRHTGQWGYSSAAEQRTVNPWAEGSNPSIPATERKHGREAEGTSLLTMRAGDRPGGSHPPASARRSDGEAVNAPVCKTGIRRSESGSELRTLSWLNRQSISFVMSRSSVRFRQTAQEYFVYLRRQTLNGYGNDIHSQSTHTLFQQQRALCRIHQHQSFPSIQRLGRHPFRSFPEHVPAYSGNHRTDNRCHHAQHRSFPKEEGKDGN